MRTWVAAVWRMEMIYLPWGLKWYLMISRHDEYTVRSTFSEWRNLRVMHSVSYKLRKDSYSMQIKFDNLNIQIYSLYKAVLTIETARRKNKKFSQLWESWGINSFLWQWLWLDQCIWRWPVSQWEKPYLMTS